MEDNQAEARSCVDHYRERMGAPDFIAECRRQSLLLKNDLHEAKILEWLESVSDTAGWDH